MAALSDLSDIINRLTGGNNGTPEHLFFQKSPRINGNPISPSGTRRLISLWLFDGIPGGVTALPGAVSAPTNATNGSLKQTNPGGGRQKWLLGMNCMSNYQGNLILYDRLLHMSGLSGSVITDQTVGGTLTRYTGSNSVGNQIWIEIFFDLGSTSTTITANYVNQNGDPKTTQPTTIGGSSYMERTYIIELPLADGDTGVRSVTSVKLNASTTAAGNFGVIVVHRLADIYISLSAVNVSTNFISNLPEIPEILPDACLALAFRPRSATLHTICGSLHMIEK